MNFQVLNLLLKCSKEFNHTRIRNCRLSDTECLICSYLSSHLHCSQEDVSKALKIDKTTTAKALLSLENKGFITREQSLEDKRKKVLKTTALGAESISNIIDLHDKWLNSILECLSSEEQLQFEAYCLRLLHAAEEKITQQTKKDNGLKPIK